MTKQPDKIEPARCIEPKEECGWMLIEANVIGKHASFTLMGYDKPAEQPA